MSDYIGNTNFVTDGVSITSYLSFTYLNYNTLDVYKRKDYRDKYVSLL